MQSGSPDIKELEDACKKASLSNDFWEHMRKGADEIVSKLDEKHDCIYGDMLK